MKRIYIEDFKTMSINELIDENERFTITHEKEEIDENVLNSITLLKGTGTGE